MNENKENQENQINILEYSIRSNGDGIYCVSIQTNVYTIVYDRAHVVFGFNDTRSVVFPLGIQVLNNKDEIVMNYSLNLQSSAGSESTNKVDE